MPYHSQPSRSYVPEPVENISMTDLFVAVQ